MSFQNKKNFWFVTAVIVIALIVGTSSLLFSQTPMDPPSKGVKKEYPRFGLPQKEASLAEGKKVYETYCAGCHGITGDGKGPAAAALNPKPRNFQTAEFRFRSTPSGELPTDEDLYRTITEGLKGSSMPAWNLLSESDRKSVIAYIKHFAADQWKDGHGAVTVIAEDPYGESRREEAIKRGEIAYHGMAQCYSCHAAYIEPKAINKAREEYKMPALKAFRADLAKAKSMTTSDGSLIYPPDFTWDKLKRGVESRTLYHIVGNGISGTPMPTWKGILPEEDLWGIVYYVQSLAGKRSALVTDEDIAAHEKRIADMENARIQFEAEMKNAVPAVAADVKAASAVATEPVTVKETPSV